MATPINWEEVTRLMAAGAQVVEVLPPTEYEAEHLPGAINLPLKQLNATTTSVLSRSPGSAGVIVYCHDYQ